MNKSLLLAPLFVIASLPAMAQFDQGTNSYDYGCGVGVPPSACGADGSQRNGSSSNQSTRKCVPLVKEIMKEMVTQLKDEYPQVKSKYLGPADGIDNAYAYKMMLDGDNEIHFVLMGNTGETYFRNVSKSNKNSKFLKGSSRDHFICRK